MPLTWQGFSEAKSSAPGRIQKLKSPLGGYVVSPFDREHHLQAALDRFLVEVLNCTAGEYAARVGTDGLMQLKGDVACVNNLLTLKLTLRLVGWLEARSLRSTADAEAERQAQRAGKPNSNGYDVDGSGIIAEVKCNVPVGGNRYGSAQRNAVIKGI